MKSQSESSALFHKTNERLRVKMLPLLKPYLRSCAADLVVLYGYYYINSSRFFFLERPQNRALIAMDTKTSIQHWAKMLKEKLMHGENSSIELFNEEATKLIDNLETFC